MPASNPRDEPSLLLRCPNEIRYLIYQHIIPTDQIFEFHLCEDEEEGFIAERARAFPYFHPDIFATCRLINEECTEVLYTKSAFALGVGVDVRRPEGSVSQPDCKIFYRQLRRMQTCHVKISLDFKVPTIDTVASDGALTVRRHLHRIVDCYESTRLRLLHLSMFNSQGRRYMMLNTVQPASCLASRPFWIARLVFIKQVYQHALDLFLQLRYVTTVTVDGNLFTREYVDSLRHGIMVLRHGRLPTRRHGSQEFWYDRDGETCHKFQFHQVAVSGETRILTLRLGPR